MKILLTWLQFTRACASVFGSVTFTGRMPSLDTAWSLGHYGFGFRIRAFWRCRDWHSFCSARPWFWQCLWFTWCRSIWRRLTRVPFSASENFLRGIWKRNRRRSWAHFLARLHAGIRAKIVSNFDDWFGIYSIHYYFLLTKILKSTSSFCSNLEFWGIKIWNQFKNTTDVAHCWTTNVPGLCVSAGQGIRRRSVESSRFLIKIRKR